MDLQEMNRAIIAEFRANQGKVGGRFQGFPMLLLTTRGAKTGKSHTVPLVYFPDGDRYIIIASYAGAPMNPPWYHNLVANPDVEIEVGTSKLQLRARALPEPERTDTYRKVEAINAVFTEYQSKTTRTIPVVVLSPK